MARNFLAHHVQPRELHADVPYRNMTLKEQLEAWKDEQRRFFRLDAPNGRRDTGDTIVDLSEYGD